ncbi:CAP domain-containing protein [Nitrosopumilus adriaticus]|uniref:SCP-like protein n=1 Tax=Nitrosopumilus adriaticus TaxID=1580092 RepID=A0A0D5C5W1_9ARCH|nr:CAP domain-containing protein [Nitrosopumilus adriaticus]AJW71755.1 SCP-like protein [Nitrosopumilus adriaticus]
MGCSHNYVFTQGYFVCTKCGKRSYGRSYKRKQGKKVTVGVIVVLIVGIAILGFSNEIFEINQNNLEQSIQNMPQSIQEVGETAKDFASDTTIILRETIDKQLDNVKMEPIDIPVDDIQSVPQIIQNNNPTNKKPIIDKLKLERQVHLLTNQYRIEHGLSQLTWDDNLANIARHHSQDMAIRNYFSHDTPEGKDPTDRATSQGYHCQKRVGNLIYSGIAENIFQNNLYDTVWYTNGIPSSYDWNNLDELATSTVDGWMDSPGHRENILTAMYDKEGIGVEISSDDKVYITQNFC